MDSLRTDNRLSLLVALSLLVVSTLACSDDAGKAPYPRYSDRANVQYTRTLPDGTQTSISAKVVGQSTIGGKKYDRYEVGDLAASTGGLEVVGKLVDASHIEVIGGTYQNEVGSSLSIPIYASAVMDSPFVVDLDPEVGVPQSFDVEGSAIIGSATATPQQSAIKGTYTLIEKGVAVETPFGLVAGCHHFEVEATVPLVLGVETTATGEVWYSPTLGLVRTEMNAPFSDLSLGFAGSKDVADLGDGWVSVQGLTLLGSGNASANFQLSSHDAFEELDADKNTHAKMLLEVRWADETKAKGDDEPSVAIEFGTTFGYFPSSLVKSTVSIFHPEENGQGYTYWVAFVDEAAKNEPTNGISYRMEVGYDSSSSPVRVTGRVLYKRVDE